MIRERWRTSATCTSATCTSATCTSGTFLLCETDNSETDLPRLEPTVARCRSTSSPSLDHGSSDTVDVPDCVLRYVPDCVLRYVPAALCQCPVIASGRFPASGSRVHSLSARPQRKPARFDALSNWRCSLNGSRSEIIQKRTAPNRHQRA